jgi:tRNA 2-thiouridine synthesizing protein E
MALEVEGKTIETTPTGFLVNQEDWNEQIAEAMAASEGIELTQRHWDVINHLRDQFFNHGGNQPNTRTLVKGMQEVWSDEQVTANSLYQLFPLDPSKQAGRIAGLPESRRKGGY